MDDILRLIHELSVPLPVRVCIATDGSLTHLLEVFFGDEVRVEAVEQEVIKADEEIATLLNMEKGGLVNWRRVLLVVKNQPLVSALSLSVLDRMPPMLRRDI